MAEKKIFTGYSFQGGGQSKNLRLESATNDPTNVGKGHTYFNSTAATIKVSNADADATAAWKTLLTTDSSIAASQVDLSNVSATGLLNTSGANPRAYAESATGDTIVSRDGLGRIKAATPTADDYVATKGYVDGVAQGLTIIDPCYLATAAALPACTYSNGSSGVGATLTGNASGALTVDGAAVSTSQRILVKDQSTASQNGIYTVTNAGSGGAAFVLTRATDYDAASEINDGDFIFVQEGTVNANRGFVQTVVTWTTAGTIGSTSITWTQFSGAGQIVAGDGLAKSGDTLSVGVASPISIVSDNVTIADLAITGAKLANNTVTSTQLADSISLTTLTATGSVTANGGFTTERPDNTAFLTMTQTGNETWSIAGRSGAGSNDYLDIGTAFGKISIGETGGLGVGDIALRDDDPQGTLHVSTARYGTNAVANGTLDGWDDSSNPASFGIYEAGSSTVSADTSVKYEGSTSAKLTIDSSNNNVYINTDGNVLSAGRKYKVSFYAQASSSIDEIAVYALGQNTTFYSPALTTSWAKYETTVTPTVDSKLLIGRHAGGNGASKSFWVDQIEVVEDCLGTPSTLGDDLVVNNNSHAGISIISKPQTNYSRLFFGDSVTNNHASIYSYRTISTGDSNLYLEASNNNTPATILTLYGNDKSAKFEGGVGIGAASGAGGQGLLVDIAAPDNWVAKIKNSSTTTPYGLQIEANTNTVTAFAVYSANNQFKVQNAHSYFSSSLAVGNTTADEKLHVAGNVILRGVNDVRLKIANNANNNWSEIGNEGSSGNNTLDFYTASSSTPCLSLGEDDTHDHKANSIVNSATVQGLQDGACYDFNPSAGTSTIDLGSGADFDYETLTYSAWIKTSSTNNDMRIVCNNASSSNPLLLIMHGGKIVVASAASNTTEEGITSTTYNDGNWHHVVAVRLSDSSRKCYVDGVEVALADSGTSWSISGNAMIGAKGNGTLHYTGSMRDVKIFPSALAASDVRKLYGGENPKKNLNVELWDNGETFSGATGGTPPQSWTEGNAGTFTLSSGGTDGTNILRIARSSDNPYIYQTQTVVVGKTYLVKYRVRNVDATKVTVGIGSSAIGTQYDSSQYTSTSFTEFEKPFTATTTTFSIYVQATTTTGTQAVEIDYARVQEVGTLVDFNSQSASSTKWYNEAIPSLYNATVTGPNLSQGNTYWNNIKQDGINVALQKDNGKLLLGADNDLQIYHDGSYNHIRSDSGSIYARTSASFIVQVDSSSGGATDALQCLTGGNVKVNNKLGVGTTANANYALWVLGKAGVQGPLTIQNSDDGYRAASIAECNNNRLAFYMPYTRNGVTKGISMGCIGAANTDTGIQCYDHSNNTANPFLINPYGGNVGIGHTTAETRLTVNSGSSTADCIAVQHGTGLAAGNGGGMIFMGCNHTNGTQYATYAKIKAGKENATQNDAQGYLSLFSRSGSGLTENLRLQSDGDHRHFNNRTLDSQTVSDTWRDSEPYLYFDNSNDYVTVSDDDNLDFSSDFSVEYWFKRYGDATGSRATSVGKKGGNWNDVGWHLGIQNSGLLYFHGANGSGYEDAVSTYTVEKEKWIHVVWTRKKFTGKVTLFVNGVEEFSETNTTYYTGSFANSNDLRIGVLGGWWQIEQGIKGVRLHNRVMTSDEIRGAYNGEVTPYKYTEAKAPSLVDYSASVFSGTSTYSWNPYGTNTVANTNNQLVITYADHSGGAYHYLKDSYRLTRDMTLGKKYRFEFEAKYTGGAAGVKLLLNDGNGGVTFYTDAFTTSMEKYSIEFIPKVNNHTVYVQLYGLASNNVVTIDNYFLYEEGEVAAWTPKSLETDTYSGTHSSASRWLDTSGNGLHGTITAAKATGSQDHFGTLRVVGNSEVGNTTNSNDGAIWLGGRSDDIRGLLDYNHSTQALTLSSFRNHSTSKVALAIHNSNKLEVIGDGTVKATSGSSGDLKQVARVHSETITIGTSGNKYAVVTHNLGTASIVVSVRLINPAGTDTGEFVETAIKTGDNSNNNPTTKCTITFAANPSSSTTYRVTVTG